MSNYVDANGVPLRLRLKLGYRADGRSEAETIHEWSLRDLYKNRAYVESLRNVGASRYNGPLVLSIARESSDANYVNFKGVLVTVRFRRVQRPGPQSGGR